MKGWWGWGGVAGSATRNDKMVSILTDGHRDQIVINVLMQMVLKDHQCNSFLNGVSRVGGLV